MYLNKALVSRKDNEIRVFTTAACLCKVLNNCMCTTLYFLYCESPREYYDWVRTHMNYTFSNIPLKRLYKFKFS